MEKDKGILTIMVLIFFLAVAPIKSTAEQMPGTISVIYLKDGREIHCDMGWIEGDTLYYRKYGGTLGISLEQVDLKKTFKKSAEKEQKWKAKEAERKARLKQDEKGVYEDTIPLSKARRFSDGTYRFGDVDVWLGAKRFDYSYKFEMTLLITNHGPRASIKVRVEARSKGGFTLRRRASTRPIRYTTKKGRIVLDKDESHVEKFIMRIHPERGPHFDKWIIPWVSIKRQAKTD